MAYLLIIVVVATVGILRLWLQQRRLVKAEWRSVNGYRTTLERVSAHPAPRLSGAEQRTAIRRNMAPATGSPGPRGVTPMDPARREAAKRRIEARRRDSRARISY